MKAAAERVQAAIAERGLDRQVIELEKTARTSQEAAAALGVEVAQIAKLALAIWPISWPKLRTAGVGLKP